MSKFKSIIFLSFFCLLFSTTELFALGFNNNKPLLKKLNIGKITIPKINCGDVRSF